MLQNGIKTLSIALYVMGIYTAYCQSKWYFFYIVHKKNYLQKVYNINSLSILHQRIWPNDYILMF